MSTATRLRLPDLDRDQTRASRHHARRADGFDAHRRGHIRIRGALEDAVHRAGLAQLAIDHDGDRIAQRHRFDAVVRHHDGGHLHGSASSCRRSRAHAQRAWGHRAPRAAHPAAAGGAARPARAPAPRAAIGRPKVAADSGPQAPPVRSAPADRRQSAARTVGNVSPTVRCGKIA